MTDLEEVKYYLDMKIEQNADCSILQLSQKIYLQQVLDHFDTDMYAKTHLIFMTEIFAKSSIIHENDEFFITDLQTDYQQITEFLLYTVIQTCLNLTTALSKLAQFNVKATFFHFKAQIRALQYVRDILDYDIIYDSKTELAIYSDADYISDLNIQKSMSDYIVIFCDESIS